MQARARYFQTNERLPYVVETVTSDPRARGIIYHGAINYEQCYSSVFPGQHFSDHILSRSKEDRLYDYFFFS